MITALKRPSIRFMLIVAAVVTVTFVIGLLVGADGMTEQVLRSKRSPLLFGSLVITLLAADIALPIPSSIVIVASGTMLGFGPGALCSAVGLTLSNLIGYAIGRRFTGEEGRTNGWAYVLFALTRGIPVLAETGSVSAGRERMPLAHFVVACIVGCVPVALILAYAGSKVV